MDEEVVQPRAGRALLAMLLALLFIAPLFVYPAAALSQGERQTNVYTLDTKLFEEAALNATSSPFLRALSSMAEAIKTMSSPSATPQNSPLQNFNLSKVTIPALLLASIDDGSYKIEYLERMMMLSSYVDFNNLLAGVQYLLTWDGQTPVTYDPSSPETSVFGGLFVHKMHFIAHVNPPTAQVDPGAGNAGELVQLFSQYTSYDFYMMTYSVTGGQLNVKMEKLGEADTVRVKDYSVYYAVVVKMNYDPRLLNVLKAMHPTNGSYIYAAVANVSFTVQLVPTYNTTLASGSTWQLPAKTYDITPYVRQALSMVASQIQSSGLPSNVTDDLLKSIYQWMNRTYTITTRHSIVKLSFHWSLVDDYTVYENGTKVGSGSEELINTTADANFTVDRATDVAAKALSKADSLLAPYYPGGIKAFAYDPVVTTPSGGQAGVSAFMLYDADQNKTIPLNPGEPSPVKPATNASLLLTAYPVKAGDHRPTEVRVREIKDPTRDYEISTSRLVAHTTYHSQVKQGNTTYDVYDYYTLTFEIDPTVVAYSIEITATPYDFIVKAEVNPTIIAKKVESVQLGKSRLIPALAPLGGNGLFTMIQGGAESINLDAFAHALDVINNMTTNEFFSTVFPTYFPIPMPHPSIKIFAPGEYIGVYYMTKSIKLKGGFLTHIGKPLFSIMYEKVYVQMKSVGSRSADDPSVAVVALRDGKLVRSTEDGFRMYSLGFAVGEIRNKVIGSRFYLSPSSTGLPGDTPETLRKILDSSLFQFLSSGNAITDLLDDVLPGEIFATAREIIDQMKTYGLYPQITPYFSGSDSIWPYFLVSPKTAYRLVADRPGDYVIRADAQFNMLHIRIFKVPILGIPVPIPVFISKHESAETAIKVRQIKALPLLVDYHIKAPEKFNAFTIGRSSFSSDSYVAIYAVPVWVDLDGTPMAPVLFRGQYGTGSQATSLTIVAVTPANTVIDGVDVYFFGVPLSMVKIPLSDLQRITPGPESYLLIKAAWKHGKVINTMDATGIPTVLRIARVKSFPLFYAGDRLVMYTGVYDPSNKIHYYLRQLEIKIDQAAGMIQSNLTKINNTLLDVISTANNIEGLLQVIDAHAGNLNDILMQISQELVHKIMEAAGGMIKALVNQFITNAIAAVVGAVVPDPTGVISGYIQDIINQLLNQMLNQLLPGQPGQKINITDLITQYGLQVMTFVALKIAYDAIGKEGLMKMIEQVKSLVMQGVDLIRRVNNTINWLLKIVNNTVEMSKYKPIITSSLYVYALNGTQIEADGLIASIAGARGKHIVLPLDGVKVNLHRGGIIYATPYSTITFLLQIIVGKETGELPNVAVSVPDALLYVAAWANFISTIADTDSGSVQNIAQTLYRVSGEITLGIAKVQQWVEIPGIDTHTILLPTMTIVPPGRL